MSSSVSLTFCLLIPILPSFYISPSPSSFSLRKCATLYIQKQHIPLRHHKVAHQPLSTGLFLHFFTLLILLSILHLFSPSTYISTGMTLVSCISPVLSPLFSTCILLPLLPCHFPPFFTLILSCGSSSVPAPPVFGLPFLSFVPSISTPFFCSSFILMLLPSYTLLSLFLEFLFSSLSVL